MSKMDELERHRLSEQVARIEMLLQRRGGSLAGEMPGLLNHFLENAKQRLAVLDLEIIAERERKQESEKREQSAIAALADRELALTAAEREVYSGFLGKEFLRRDDFPALAGFYSGAYDRLTEDGKGEMSRRVWGGVRHQQYEFSELPEVVRRKEAERLQRMLTQGEGLDLNLERIPAADRREFLSAWKAGDRAEACKILDRPGFTENVAVSSCPIVAEDGRKQAESDRSALAAALARKETSQPRNEAKPVSDADLSAIDLEAMDPEKASSKPTELPVHSASPPASLKR